MDTRTFFRELRRRNVYKVAIAYAVIAWFVFECASAFLFDFDGRAQLMTVLTVILVAGFLVALFISWAFEATPEGMKRTENVPPEVAATLPSWSKRKFTLFVVIIAVIAAGLHAFDMVRSRHLPASPQATATP